MPSVTDCPERLVPAALKVIGTRCSWLKRKRRLTSSMDAGWATPFGTSR
jgi:hypothetical protein